MKKETSNQLKIFYYFIISRRLIDFDARIVLMLARSEFSENNYQIRYVLLHTKMLFRKLKMRVFLPLPPPTIEPIIK